MKNKRKNKRFELAEDVMFAHQLTNPYCYYGGSTINYSMDGICLTSRYEVEFGDNLCLRMIGDHLQSSTSIDGLTCMAEVKWCQSISRPPEPKYHIGLNYVGQVPDLFRPGLH
jgi:hypothetical protein